MKKIRMFFCSACMLTALCSLSVSAASLPVTETLEKEADTLTSYGMLPVYGRDIKDGSYPITLKSNSPLLQEASASVTVKDGVIDAQITLSLGDYPELFIGTASEAETNSDKRIMAQEASGGLFTYAIEDVALNKEFNCAVFSLLDGLWYDNLLLFDAASLPGEALLVELPDYDAIQAAMDSYKDSEGSSIKKEAEKIQPMSIDLEDGEYSIQVECIGGSGKASVSSPTLMVVKEGKAYARLQWSSPNYDYMLIGDEKYLNEKAETGGNSVFTIPIAAMDTPIQHIANTTAMEDDHEIVYTFTFYRDSIGSKGQIPQEAAKKVVIIALIMIVGGGVLNHILKKKHSV